MEPINSQTGLSARQAQEQQQKGNINLVRTKNTTSVTKILSKNLFTLFNLVNLVIAILIFCTHSYANLFFLGPVIGNFVIGSCQEIYAKKQLDKLTLLNRQRVTVLRDGQKQTIFQDELVLHDLIMLQRGQQVPADGTILQTAHLEVDESNITGESVAVVKANNDQLLSGSLVTSGQALVKLTSVGEDSFANRLAHSARKQSHNVSQLLNLINRIIKILTYIIVPLGILMFTTSWLHNHQFNQAILGTSASIIGMIPQGLVLLTSVALAVGALHLSRKKVLVKSMTSLESLARVDTLCLDKTGTITTGNLKLSHIISEQISENELLQIAQQIMLANNENNETAQAILADCQSKLTSEQIQSVVAFSSERKWSAANFSDGRHYAIGAPNFILQDPQLIKTAHHYGQQGLRVLAVVQTSAEIVEQIVQPQFLGFLLIQDEVRTTAKTTFEYLREQGVQIKIISGDDPTTVQTIAQQVEIQDCAQAIDMSTVDPEADLATFEQIADQYTVFGRTLPEQKQKLIQGLQAKKHQVAMAGDGVNDVLAMRQSDCAIAIAGNSEAAESAADFVLLNKNFDSLIYVLNEGRRVINNIERVASLYLLKTMYSVLLTLIFICIGRNYPFYPAQMTPFNALTIGIPTFVLTLRPDFRAPEGRFYRNVMQVALPAALEITALILIINSGGTRFGLTYVHTSTLSVLVTCLVGFAALWTIARPINRGIIIIFIGFFILSMLFFTIWGAPFKLFNIFHSPVLLVTIALLIIFYPLFNLIREILVRYCFKN
ncbi:HAD-IC family P-type ATPase [Bombilactobacillus thymidiniphilus]|uniref:HAD-IC family P-type ATPase n=1 Tax=Bombilactobacillus thymidiniphilus TaxID=2923363 RepID=A0ABY4PBJ1_9LACO|nr:HAD-IC family P-type ATPase [Bombilactobacillus thymidiniphilus]UQS83042.1 HAD-IC family P-type ATPase [Bombilactobacillus thymidiniphilus]